LLQKLTGWWVHQANTGRWLLISLLSIALLLSIGTSWSVFNTQNRERDSAFHDISSTVLERIVQTVGVWVSQGESGRDLIQLSDGISGERYWQFSQHLTDTYPVMKAVDYLPRVLDSERANYERERSLELGIEYSIRDFDDEGNLVCADQRPEYYPASDGRLRGWDIATDPNMGSLLMLSDDQNTPDGVIIPSPLDPDEFRIVVAYPIYDSQVLSGDSYQDPESIRAFTLMVLGITDLVEQATVDAQEFVAIRIVADVGGQAETLYMQDSTSGSGDSITHPVEILGTEWTVTTTRLAALPGRWPDQFPVIISFFTFLITFIVAISITIIISQRRDALAQADELRVVSDSKTQFLSTVSHELKTPLTSVIAFTDLVKRNRDAKLTERQVDQLSIVQRSSQQLNVLIDDLLDVSNIADGKLRIKPIKFDAALAMRKLADGLSPIFESKAQSIRADISDESLWVDADQFRIEQVI
jgi:signal transduction histidine kinase